MSDIAQALAVALTAAGRFTFVSGRTVDGLAALAESAAQHVVAPGPSTRLHVAAGVRLGGHRAVVAVDEVGAGQPPDTSVVAVTTSQQCARNALAGGWSVLQPWAAGDVAPLLEAAPEPLLILLGPSTVEEIEDPPAPRRSRLWLDGDIATLVASGEGVPHALSLANRLLGRGVEVAVVEIAILDDPGQAALVGGTSLLVAGRDTASAFRGTHWPEVPVSAIALDGRQEADLVGSVLAQIPTT